MDDFNVISISNVMLHAIMKQAQREADGCQMCAFEDCEDWEMPCCKCKRACKDYWRIKKSE